MLLPAPASQNALTQSKAGQDTAATGRAVEELGAALRPTRDRAQSGAASSAVGSSSDRNGVGSTARAGVVAAWGERACCAARAVALRKAKPWSEKANDCRVHPAIVGSNGRWLCKRASCGLASL